MSQFWEDENELPYLVSSRRDNEYSSDSHDSYDEFEDFKNHKDKSENLDDVLNSIYISDSKRRVLKNKVKSLLNARDCVSLNVEDGFDGCIFTFTRENEYIRTVDEFEYYPSMSNDKRVFHECYTTHNYDNLLKSPRFQDMIEKTGFEFIGCNGGYVTDYSMADDEFTFKDEIEVKVLFKVGSRERSYVLDLEKMKLSEDYFEY